MRVFPNLSSMISHNISWTTFRKGWFRFDQLITTCHMVSTHTCGSQTELKPWTKWATFADDILIVCLYFDTNFNEFLSKGFIWHWFLIGPGNGLVPNGHQAITWTKWWSRNQIHLSRHNGTVSPQTPLGYVCLTPRARAQTMFTHAFSRSKIFDCWFTCQISLFL